MVAAGGDALDSFPRYELRHERLGKLIGLSRGDDIIQFRGVPFATIAARFRQARLLEALPRQPFDPILSPATATISFLLGRIITRVSRRCLRPAFNKEHGEPTGNYGLHDQRQTLEWCNKFISGFGGDAANITIQGTSAGGSSAHYLSTFPARKFKRAILASGTLTGIGPMPMTYQQERFAAYMSRHTSRDGEPSGNPVSLLQSIPVDDFVKPITASIYHPYIDGDWISGATMHDVCAVYTSEAAPDLMIGACDFEADLTQLLLVDDIPSMTPAPDDRMRATIFDLASSDGMIVSPETFPDAYPSVTEAYNISLALEHSSSAMYKWADLLADIALRIPPLHIAAHHPANVLLYEIRCKNSYEKWAWSFGRANHAVNDVFLFDVAPDLMSKQLQSLHAGNVAQIRAAWLDFCYGKLPWAPYRQQDNNLGPIHVFDHGEKGRDAESLEDAVGRTMAAQWRAVLEANTL